MHCQCGIIKDISFAIIILTLKCPQSLYLTWIKVCVFIFYPLTLSFQFKTHNNFPTLYAQHILYKKKTRLNDYISSIEIYFLFCIIKCLLFTFIFYSLKHFILFSIAFLMIYLYNIVMHTYMIYTVQNIFSLFLFTMITKIGYNYDWSSKKKE